MSGRCPVAMNVGVSPFKDSVDSTLKSIQTYIRQRSQQLGEVPVRSMRVLVVLLQLLYRRSAGFWFWCSGSLCQLPMTR